MKVYASILIFILVFNSCMERKKNGSCDSTAHVRYRNLNFQFPITGKEVAEKGTGVIRNIPTYIRTDFPNDHGSVNWYFDYSQNKVNTADTTRYLAKAAIYGATVFLDREADKSDQDIIDELQKVYPGKFVHSKNPDYPYYIFTDGCLSIILRRLLVAKANSVNAANIPTVSFCYGLSGSELTNYAKSPGHLGNRLGIN